MTTRTLFTTVALMSSSLMLASAAPQEKVTAAAKKLAEAGSYSWKMTYEGGNFNPGPTMGKTANGNSIVTRTRRDNTYQTVYQGEKAAMETEEGWMSIADLEADTENRRNRFWARMLENFETPAQQAQALLKDTQDLKEADGVITGKLTEAGVKRLMSFRRGRDAEGPDVTDPAGSVKFWIKDGVLTKYEYHVQGGMSFNGNDVDVDRTATVELSDIGTTKVEIPEAAKKKLS